MNHKMRKRLQEEVVKFHEKIMEQYGFDGALTMCCDRQLEESHASLGFSLSLPVSQRERIVSALGVSSVQMLTQFTHSSGGADA